MTPVRRVRFPTGGIEPPGCETRSEVGTLARTVEHERVQQIPPPAPRPAPDRRALLLKHALDRLIAAGGLLVTAPVIAGVALALRLRGGPVLDLEQRIGAGGRTVVVRTFAIPETDGWRVLVRLGVPALPQLFSVLGGSMSIVGPRPREPGFEAPPARPGLTGLAQLAQLERRLSVAERLELDDRYARTWSLGLDARILWRTVTSGRGRKVRA
jgi:lipopolysaccharide/colanic/teichoic acid biosynthesis glycosyltransferase